MTTSTRRSFTLGILVGLAIMVGAAIVGAAQAQTSPDPYALYGRCMAQLQALPEQVVTQVRAAFEKANPGQTLDASFKIQPKPDRGGPVRGEK